MKLRGRNRLRRGRLVRAREPGVTDYFRDQNRRNLPGFGIARSQASCRIGQERLEGPPRGAC